MERNDIGCRRININYAAIQSMYYSGFCVINGFTAVFLIYKGLSSTQIGFTTALFSIIAIILQIFLSNYLDKQLKQPLKRVIIILFLLAITACVCLYLVPLPIAMMIIVYSVAVASHSSNNGLINAMMMQFINIGLPVNYGWPRGIGSISYALMAYSLGILIDQYSPNILLPIYIVLTGIAIIFVLIMPDPNRFQDNNSLIDSNNKKEEAQSSYIKMLFGSPTLVLFLCVCIISAIGESSMTFLIRIIESLGGGTKELGISMFIQSGVELPAMFASARILKKYKPDKILCVSFFCIFLKILMIALAPSLKYIYLIMTFNIFCMGLFGVSSVLFVNNIVRSNEKVRAQSLMSICYTRGIGGIIGNAFSGYMIDVVGLRHLLLISCFICVGATILMCICSYSYKKQI